MDYRVACTGQMLPEAQVELLQHLPENPMGDGGGRGGREAPSPAAEDGVCREPSWIAMGELIVWQKASRRRWRVVLGGKSWVRGEAWRAVDVRYWPAQYCRQRYAPQANLDLQTTTIEDWEVVSEC